MSIIYTPSAPDGRNMGDVLLDLIKGKGNFWYFRQVIRMPKKWWQKRFRFIETGDTWEPQKRSEFRVIHLA